MVQYLLQKFIFAKNTQMTSARYKKRRDIMKIHYFQRYHSKENVATANTMLLLSRLYSYSADKFFHLIKSEFFFDSFEPEPIFTLQEKSSESVPDATIKQEGFKLVVETKMFDWFHPDQLERHLKAFNDEKNKVLITLAPEYMEKEKKAEFDKLLSEYNKKLPYPIIHINTTFEELAEAFRSVIDDRDHEMQDVLEDYLNYCYNDGLIPVSDSWKWLRVQLAGKTFDFNISSNLYYDDIERGFRPHDYLGLYKEKSVKAIGKITDIITVTKDNNDEISYNAEQGSVSDEKKQSIADAIADGKRYGYTFDATRFFFVEKFIETDYKKITSRAPMGSRVFDLTEVLDTDNLPDNTETIAEILKTKTWE